MAVVTLDTNHAAALDWSAKGKDRIVQNVLNIMRTYKGEVAYNRGFGISPDVIDKPADEVQAIIADDLSARIEQDEPRARLLSVVANYDASGDVVVTVKIEV
jgi:phage baseplate assembly protein W